MRNSRVQNKIKLSGYMKLEKEKERKNLVNLRDSIALLFCFQQTIHI